MPTTYVNAPDGNKIPVNHPEGATQAEIIAYAKQNYKPAGSQNSTLEDLAAAGQVAAEGASMGILGDEVAAIARTGIDYAMDAFIDNPLSEESDVQKDSQDFVDRLGMYLDDSRRIEENFRRDHRGAAMGIDLATGLGTGVAVAGKLGNAATRLGNVGRQSAAAGAEMAVRGAMEGEGLEDRLKKGAMYGAGGAAIGALGGSLMRGADEIKVPTKRDKPTAASLDEDSLAGKEGFSSKATREKAGKSKIGYVADDLKTRAAKLVSPRFGKLMNEADGNKMRRVAETVSEVDNTGAGLRNLDRFFHSKKGQLAHRMIVNANAKVGPNGETITEPMRKQMLDRATKLISEQDPKLAETFLAMRQKVREMAQDDILIEATEGYFPRRASSRVYDRKTALKKKKEGWLRGKSRLKPFEKTSSAVDSNRPWVKDANQLKDYRAPTAAFMDYIEEAATLDEVVKVFKLDDILYPGSKFTQNKEGVTYDSAAKAIARGINNRLKKQGASKDIRNDAMVLMEDFVENSRIGPSQALQGLRTATSVALLGTPENAVLQFGDQGVAAYQNGLINALKTLPKSMKSMIFTKTDDMTKAGYDDFMRAPDLGITRQFLGEMKREGDHPLTALLDWGGNKIMSGAGVRKVNRMGQEVAINASWGRAKQLAKSDPDRLAKELKGWQPEETRALINDLKDGDKDSDLVKSYLFSRITDIQPVSATALPQAYARHPNGRILYAMKTYMVKQSQIMRDDIFGKFAAAEKAGLNTPEGKKLGGEAMKNAGRYVAFVAAVNAVVDEKRKVPRTGEDNYDPVASTANQLVSNVSGGVLDLRGGDYGKTPASGMIPPALQYPSDVTQALLTGAYEGDPEVIEDVWKAMERYTPGLRQVKWISDVAENN